MEASGKVVVRNLVDLVSVEKFESGIVALVMAVQMADSWGSLSPWINCLDIIINGIALL